MRRYGAFLVILILATVLMSSVADAAIRRVAARYNLVNFYGGYASPWGEYNEIGLVRFVDELDRPVNIDADEAFDGTFYVGFDYGTLWTRNVQFMLGFRFTDHQVQDWIFESSEEFNYRQYDVEFNLNFYPIDITQNPLSPYVGVGFQAGLLSTEVEGFDNESDIKLAGSVNFGADFKVYEAPGGRSFITLASMNNFNVIASDDRPKYLNIGGALRYWFR